jgi:hypothetical protein
MNRTHTRHDLGRGTRGTAFNLVILGLDPRIQTQIN